MFASLVKHLGSTLFFIIAVLGFALVALVVVSNRPQERRTDIVGSDAQSQAYPARLTPSPLSAESYPAPADLVLGWQELSFNATRARLPDGLVSAEGSTIQVSMPRGIISYPLMRIDGRAWVAGPYQPSISTAPIDIRVNKTAQLLELNVMVYWNVWTDSASPGYALFQQARKRLEALGWKQKSCAAI